ncbi:putative membrane protein [Kaistella chaponensis]|jgi:putative membrane protein|uniref:Putative membrane protein n=1 Tax=Kaistella chaponensis TaxID=713588 RepID=A0A1N7KK80_9FLAO|nr:bestrophin family ion channel [Kaistella chaponensis]SIS61998.1 putative membrane protein [Kaistella chaponensis]
MLLNRKISILYFVNNIKWQILFVITFALAVGFLHLRPEFKGIDIPLNILTLLGTIVTILLAFRTSQSYERWWEARTIWGAIVNDSRTLTRTVLQFLPENESVEKKKFAERQIIFVNALGETLRKVPLSPKVEAYVKFHNINAVNLPNALLDEHSHQIGQLKTEAKISDFQQLQLNDIVSRLCDSMGKCERIKNTVFPRSYSLILHILIYAFTAILPFSLNHNQFVTEIAISIIIPLLFIAVEKTAIIMQDPFENSPVDTPMTSIAQTIEINILQMMGEKDVPAKEDKGLYYEM